jgi:hypothetical protein
MADDGTKTAMDAIFKLFEMDQDPIKEKWPRKVGNHELPPQRRGISYADREPNPFFRELVSDGQGGFRPWTPPMSPRQREAATMQEDLQMMRDYLREGSVAPPDKKK